MFPTHAIPARLSVQAIPAEMVPVAAAAAAVPAVRVLPGQNGGNGAAGWSMYNQYGPGMNQQCAPITSEGQAGNPGGGGTGGLAGASGTAGVAGTAGTVGGDGTMTLSGASVAVTGTIGTSSYSFHNNSSYSGYSLYAGTHGSIAIWTSQGKIPTTYFSDANYGTATSADKGSVTIQQGLPTLAGSSFPTYSLHTTGAELTIVEGGVPVIETGTKSVTPAELVALVQMSTNGVQTLTLDSNGNATAGSGSSFTTAAANVPSAGFTDLVLPSGVTDSYTASTTVSGVTTSTLTISSLNSLPATATINGALNFSSSATVTATSVTIGSGGSLSTAGSSLTVNTPTLTNGGAMSANAASSTITVQNPTTLTLSGTGTMTATNVIIAPTGTAASSLSLTSGALGITGIANLKATTITLGSSASVTASGNANVTVATLNDNGALGSTGGTLAITSPASSALTINGATGSSQGSLSGAAINLVASASNLTFSGNLDFTGPMTTRASSGSVIVLANANLLGQNSSSSITDNATTPLSPTPTWTINSGALVEASSFTGGMGTLTNNGILETTSGAISITHSTGITVNGTGNLEAATNINLNAVYGAVSASQNVFVGGVQGTAVSTFVLTSSSTGSDNLALGTSGITAPSSITITMDGNGTLINSGTVSSLSVTANIQNLTNNGTMTSTAYVGSGSLTIQSPSSLTINNIGSLTAPTTPAMGNYGGMIQLLALNGTLSIVGGTGTINASGATYKGGVVCLDAQTITTSGSGPVNISANGGTANASVAGGNISIIATAAGNSLAVGTGAGQFNLSATSGCPTCTTDYGGTVVVSSGGNLSVNTAGLNVAPSGTQGYGGTIALLAGTAGAGTLQVAGSLNVNGVGAYGSAGKIFLVYNDSTNPFVIGGTVTNSGVTGNVTASAPGYGTGGTIVINNISTNCCAAVNINLAGTLSSGSSKGGSGTVILNDTTINTDLPVCCNGTEKLPGLPVFSNETLDVNIGGSGNLNGLKAGAAGSALFINSPGGLSTQTVVSSGNSSVTLSSLGTITINNGLYLPGENLAIVSGGNIVTGSGASYIETNGSTGNGGSITMVAGAAFTVGNGLSPVCCNATDLIITGPSSTGGNIDLYHGTQLTTIESLGANYGNGGNITFVAYAGANGANGSITLPPAGVIYSGGSTYGANGNVLMIAGATTGTGISTGLISTSSAGNPGTGTIGLYTAQPSISGGVGGTSCVVIDNGAMIYGSFVPGAATKSSITTGTVASNGNSTSGGALTTNGAAVTINSGGNMLIGTINTNPVYSLSGAAAGGYVNLTAAGSINVSTITTSPYLSTDGAGNIYITAGTGGSGSITTAGISSSGGNAGGLAVLSAPGTITSSAQYYFGGKMIVQAGSNINLYGVNTEGATTSADLYVSSTAGNLAISYGGIYTDPYGTGGVSGNVYLNAPSGTISLAGGINTYNSYGASGKCIYFRRQLTMLPTRPSLQAPTGPMLPPVMFISLPPAP